MITRLLVEKSIHLLPKIYRLFQIDSVEPTNTGRLTKNFALLKAKSGAAKSVGLRLHSFVSFSSTLFIWPIVSLFFSRPPICNFLFSINIRFPQLKSFFSELFVTQKSVFISQNYMPRSCRSLVGCVFTSSPWPDIKIKYKKYFFGDFLSADFWQKL